MTEQAQALVDQFRRMVEPDGGQLEFLSVIEGTLRVKYTPGHNEECDTCVIEPDDLRELMKETLQRRSPSIKEVELIIAH